ncbi:MAG: ERF family protein [Archangium sp.]|nr:ERF family protein [Archangium sp.]
MTATPDAALSVPASIPQPALPLTEGQVITYVRDLISSGAAKVDRRRPGPKLAAALAQAQGEFINIPKDREVEVVPKDGGKGYTFRYATLPAIMKVVRAPLSKHEISLLMYPTVHHREGIALQYIEVTAYLTHSSGECVVGSIEIPFQDNKPQKLGVIISYCRRYLVNTLLGIAQEDESDLDDQGVIDGPPPMANNLTPAATQRPAAKPPEVKTAAPTSGAPAATPPSPSAGAPLAAPTGPAPTEADFHLQFDEAKTEPELTKVGASINEWKHTLTIEEQARLTAKFKKRREEIRAGGK